MSRYRELRNDILQVLGARCVACGCTDLRVLQIDHVYGGGCDERRELGSGVTYLKTILADVTSGRYQILCPTCNQLKKITNFEDRYFDLDAVYDLETVFH